MHYSKELERMIESAVKGGELNTDALSTIYDQASFEGIPTTEVDLLLHGRAYEIKQIIAAEGKAPDVPDFSELTLPERPTLKETEYIVQKWHQELHVQFLAVEPIKVEKYYCLPSLQQKEGFFNKLFKRTEYVAKDVTLTNFIENFNERDRVIIEYPNLRPVRPEMCIDIVKRMTADKNHFGYAAFSCKIDECFDTAKEKGWFNEQDFRVKYRDAANISLFWDFLPTSQSAYINAYEGRLKINHKYGGWDKLSCETIDKVKELINLIKVTDDVDDCIEALLVLRNEVMHNHNKNLKIVKIFQEKYESMLQETVRKFPDSASLVSLLEEQKNEKAAKYNAAYEASAFGKLSSAMKLAKDYLFDDKDSDKNDD